MTSKHLWRLSTVVSLLAVVAMLAIACGDDDDEEATPTPAGTAAASPTPAVAKPGDAGIASDPRDARGLEGVFELDDGLAMWKERPASEDRTGVTDDTIILGRTAPLTGFLATYEAVWGPYLVAMIDRINEAGGIHGRKIDLRIKDDASGGPEGVPRPLGPARLDEEARADDRRHEDELDRDPALAARAEQRETASRAG